MLAGVRIVDTTRLLPGPYAGWLLAEMGAEVIKVEQPGRGDYMRENWPRRDGMSTIFHLYNRGKRSAAFNLKHPDGRRAFLELVATADVVLDGNRPGVMDRLRCGWEACREVAPAIVFCAITGFGQNGPYRDRVGHDINYLGLSGALSAFADERGRPHAPRLTISDMAGGGLMAVAALLGALLRARMSSEGRFVDVSMTDTLVSMQGLRLAEGLLPGDPQPADQPRPDSNDNEFGVYVTGDGRFLSVDPSEARFKDTLWAIIESDGAGRRPPAGANRETVHAALADAIKARPAEHWEQQLARAEACYAPVYSLQDLVRDPQIQARRLLGDAMDPSVSSPGLGSPVAFSPPARDAELGPAPRLGQHTEQILRELGWTSGEIAQALSAGAVELAEPAARA